MPAAPASSLVWALLAEHALADDGDPVAAYAYARTGYHRGPRRAAPRGLARPRADPRDHEPNQGFLRSLLALAEAAEAIGESDGGRRGACTFLLDCGTSVDEVAGLR